MGKTPVKSLPSPSRPVRSRMAAWSSARGTSCSPIRVAWGSTCVTGPSPLRTAFLAERDSEGGWRRVTYGEGQSLLKRLPLE